MLVNVMEINCIELLTKSQPEARHFAIRCADRPHDHNGEPHR